MPHSFLCDAETLLELAIDFYGRNKWFNLAQMAIVHSIFLEIVMRIYKGEPSDLAVCALPNQHRWQNVVKIVNLGRKNGIPENDWALALSVKIKENDSNQQDG